MHDSEFNPKYCKNKNNQSTNSNNNTWDGAEAPDCTALKKLYGCDMDKVLFRPEEKTRHLFNWLMNMILWILPIKLESSELWQWLILNIWIFSPIKKIKTVFTYYWSAELGKLLDSNGEKDVAQLHSCTSDTRACTLLKQWILIWYSGCNWSHALEKITSPQLSTFCTGQMGELNGLG